MALAKCVVNGIFEDDKGFTIKYNKLDFQVSMAVGPRMHFPQISRVISVFPPIPLLVMNGMSEHKISTYEQPHICELLRTSEYDTLHTEYPGDYRMVLVENGKITVYNSPESTLPIFYTENSFEIVVSTVHCELPINLVNEIDSDILAYMLYGINYLPYKNIYILNPCNWMKIFKGLVECKKLEVERKYEIDIKGLSLSDFSEYFMNRILSTFEKLLEKSKKIGVLLSGGIDSALLTYCIRKVNADAILYTWATPSIAMCNEWEDAHLVAEIVKYPHRKIIIDGNDFNYGILDQSNYCIPLLHNYSKAWDVACYQMAEDGVDTIITGYGASIFETTDYNLKTLIKNLPFKDAVSECFHASANPFFKLSDIVKSRSIFSQTSVDFLRSIDYFNDDYREKIGRLNYENHKFNMQEYAQEVNIFQKYGLICYHPYRTNDIINLAVSLPDSCKGRMHMGQYINKILLRYTMIDKLPQKIISKTYPASMSALIQKYVLSYNNENDILNALEPLIDMKIIDLKLLKGVLNDSKQIRMNAQSLHTCLLFSQWVKNNKERLI